MPETNQAKPQKASFLKLKSNKGRKLFYILNAGFGPQMFFWYNLVLKY